MDKLRMESPDMTAQNIDRIAALFPNCITEMLDEEHSTPEKKVYKRAVNFELLKQMLSPDVVDGDEAYEFTWVGKKAAIVEANKPIRKTLRPCVEESKDWDTTENLYIEGDNLEVLKLLQESYLGKVKMIYIDPPYNTGSDRFIYPDDYGMTQDEYETASEVYDEEGNKVFSENLSSNPRYHSKWCSMIYQRLLLARGFLTEDGAIFISIDDKEQENLKKICDEVFGVSNYVSTIVWQHSIQPKGYLGNFSIQHSYVLIYCKDALSFKLGSLERTDEDNKAYSNPDNDPKGPWRSGDVRNALYRPNLIYDIISPSGKVIKPCENGWRWSKETVAEKIKSGEIIFSADETRIIRKIYLSTLEGRAPETIWFGKDVGTTREGISELKQLFGQAPFDTPKPTRLIERCITLMNDPQMLIMDFFSGSATTAEAIMKANSKDGGHRTSIQIQYPEECGISSPAKKMGYSTISEIGKERIRRAGNQSLELSLENLEKEGIIEKVKLSKLSVLSSKDSKSENLEKEGVIEKYAGELSEIRSLEEVYRSCGTGLYSGQEAPEGGNLRAFGPDAAGGGIDSVEHCRGAVTGKQGVYPVFESGKGITCGTGNTIVDMRTLELLNAHGYRIKFESLGRNQQNALFLDKASWLEILRSKLSVLSSDRGFRVLKLDDTNMKDVYYAPDDYDQGMLAGLESNIKDDRTDLDLLFGCLIDWGLPLSLPYKSELLGGCTIHTYNDGDLIACFDKNIPESVVKEIAQRKPLRAVFRDSGFASSPEKINVFEIFKLYMPEDAGDISKRVRVI